MAVLIRQSLSTLDLVIFGDKIDEQNSLGFITNDGIKILGHSSLMNN